MADYPTADDIVVAEDNTEEPTQPAGEVLEAQHEVSAEEATPPEEAESTKKPKKSRSKK